MAFSIPHFTHVLRSSVATLPDHHRRRLEDGVRDLRNAELLMVRLLRRDDRRVGGQHEMNAPKKDVEVAITKW